MRSSTLAGRTVSWLTRMRTDPDGMAAILDKQNGKRFGQVQFVNEVVDFIATAEGRQPCYELLAGLQDQQAGRDPDVRTITLGDAPGIPENLRGSTYELVEGESDAEKFDREWPGGAMTTAVAAAEVDLGLCAVCGVPMLAGEEYLSVIEVSVDGTVTKVSNQHAACRPTEHDETDA